MKKFLILQLRPNKAGEYEYRAFLEYGGLSEEETHRVEMTEEGVPDVNLDDYAGILIGGGACCVSDEEKPDYQVNFEKQLQPLLKKVTEEDFPFLGACYGFGALAEFLGGKVEKDPACAEDVEGLDIYLTNAAKSDPLTQGLPPVFRAFAGHKESCTQLPPDVDRLARSKRCPNHMFRYKNNVYATQFHPELDMENILIRIDVYKNDGYFPPEDAQTLKDKVKDESVTVPMKILKRWVESCRDRA